MFLHITALAVHHCSCFQSCFIYSTLECNIWMDNIGIPTVSKISCILWCKISAATVHNITVNTCQFQYDFHEYRSSPSKSVLWHTFSPFSLYQCQQSQNTDATLTMYPVPFTEVYVLLLFCSEDLCGINQYNGWRIKDIYDSFDKRPLLSNLNNS